MVNIFRVSIIFGIGVVLLSACSPPGPIPIVQSSTSTVHLTNTFTPVPSSTNTFRPIPTATQMTLATPAPASPSVIRTTLCWAGPGPVYEVISALQKNERVVLLGRGSVDGWLVVENPIYHDPCWVMAGELWLDHTTDVSALTIFEQPPTPTASATLPPFPTATITRTFTPSLTPVFTPTLTATVTITPTP